MKVGSLNKEILMERFHGIVFGSTWYAHNMGRMCSGGIYI